MRPTDTQTETEARVEALRGRLQSFREAIEVSFLGQREVVDLLTLCVLAEGHALLEGAPGLGKTTLVKGLATALDLDFQRVQFTPDLMPADVLGTRILERGADGGPSFRFERGPIFANVLLGDEINRATPRTQSALLEAMQERQVTIFGERMPLPSPFCVVATQNPIEMEGTYPLPEAQLDRFLCKIEVAAPGEDELVAILEATTAGTPTRARAVLSGAEVLELRGLVRSVPASSDVLRDVARLVGATHPGNPRAPEGVRRYLRYGASPRGGQAVLLLSKARALVRGRPWVAREDLRAVAAPALRHRLVFGYEGEASGIHPDELLAEALDVALDG